MFENLLHSFPVTLYNILTVMKCIKFDIDFKSYLHRSLYSVTVPEPRAPSPISSPLGRPDSSALSFSRAEPSICQWQSRPSTPFNMPGKMDDHWFLLSLLSRHTVYGYVHMFFFNEKKEKSQPSIVFPSFQESLEMISAAVATRLQPVTSALAWNLWTPILWPRLQTNCGPKIRCWDCRILWSHTWTTVRYRSKKGTGFIGFTFDHIPCYP